MTYQPGLNGGRINATIGGNTAGAGALASTGTVTLAGGNNITLSQAGNAITISGGAAGGFSAGMSTGGNTVGTTGLASNQLVFAGGNNVTLSQSTAAGGNNTLSISAIAPQISISGFTTTGTTTGISDGPTSLFFPSFVVSQSSNSVSINGPSPYALSAGMSGGNTAGAANFLANAHLFLAGGNNITLSNATNITSVFAIDETISIMGNPPTSLGVSNIGNTVGTSGTVSNQMIFAGGNNITLSQSTAAGGNTITISAPSQSVQSQSLIAGLYDGANSISTGTVRLTNANNVTFSINGQTLSGSVAPNLSVGMSGLGNTVGTTGLVSNRMVLAGGNNITLSQSTAAAGNTITISASQTVQTQNMVVLYDGANSISSGTASFADGNNISFGINGQTITGSVAPSLSAGLSALGNTAGTTGLVSNQIVFAGGNNITLSQSTGAGGNTLSISAPNIATASAPFAQQIAGNSTSAGAGYSTVTSGTMQWAGGNNITLSQNGQTVTISGGNGITWSYFNPQDAYVQVAGVQGQNTLHIQPMQAPNVQFDRAIIPIVASITATSATATFGITYQQGLYTRNASTLSLLTSWSMNTSFQYGTSNSSLWGGGLKMLSIPFTTTLSESQYWMGNLYSTSSAGANALSFSQIVASQQNSNLSGLWGVSSNSSVQYTRGLGIYNTTTGALPSSIGFNQINGTGSMVLRQPMFYLVSGTF